MHQGCDGSFGGGAGVVDKLRMMGYSGMAMPVETRLVCEGCGTSFQMKTMEDRCPQMGDKRLVIKNGGIAKIIASSDAERKNLSRLEELDNTLLALRNRIRFGETLEEL